MFPCLSTSLFGILPLTRADIESAARGGFRHVELYARPGCLCIGHDAQINDIIQATESAAVTVYAVHAYWSEWCDISSRWRRPRTSALAYLRSLMAVAGRLRAKVIVVHPSWHPIRPRSVAKRMALAACSLKELADMAESEGLRLAAEVMAPPCVPYDSEGMVELLDAVGRPEVVGACLDMNHVNLTEDPADAVRRLGRRMIHVHVSDNDGAAERHWVPYEGVIDWPTVMQAISEVCYEGALSFEVGMNFTMYSLDEMLVRLASVYRRMVADVGRADGQLPRRNGRTGER